MASVKEELVRIQDDTEALVTLVGSNSGISRELSKDVSRFSGRVEAVLGDISSATGRTVEYLDHQLTELRDRCVAAIEDTGALLYRGQKEQAATVAGSVIGAGFIGGLFSLLGTALAGRLISDAIIQSSKNIPPSTDELKERALLLLVAKLQRERSYIPAEAILERAAGPGGILSAQEAKRFLDLLQADEVLETRTNVENAPVRLNRQNSRAREILASGSHFPSEQPVAYLDFCDLGPRFGVSMAPAEAARVNHIIVLKTEKGKGFQVRVDFTIHGSYRQCHESDELGSREEAEELRLETEARLRKVKI